jgi:hypothetical protein
MMDTSWFNKQFIDYCLSREVEPMITGNDVLVLVCPKIPTAEIQKAIKEMVPSSQPIEFMEGLSAATQSTINKYLGSKGITAVMYRSSTEGRVLVDVLLLDQSGKLMPFSEISSVVLQPGYRLWTDTAYHLKQDKYVKAFQIRLNGKIVLSEGEGFPEENDLADQIEPSFDEPGHLDLIQPEPAKPLKITGDPYPKINGKPVDQGRASLPELSATDIDILFGTSNSFDDFLAKL